MPWTLGGPKPRFTRKVVGDRITAAVQPPSLSGNQTRRVSRLREYPPQDGVTKKKTRTK